MVDQSISIQELSKVFQNLRLDINQVSTKISSLTSIVKDTFPIIDKSTSYADKLASVFNETSISTKDFTDRLYRLGAIASNNIKKINEVESTLIRNIKKIGGGLKKPIEENQKDLLALRDTIKNIAEGIREANNKLQNADTIGHETYTIFINSFKKLNEGVKNVLEGTVPTNIQETIDTFRKIVSENIKEIKEGEEGPIYLDEKEKNEIRVIKTLKEQLKSLSEKTKILSTVSSKYNEKIKDVKDQLTNYLNTFLPIIKGNKNLRTQYALLFSQIKKLGNEIPFTGDTIGKLVTDIGKFKSIAEDLINLTKEYSESTAEFIIWQNMANNTFKRFSDKIAQFPKPIQTIATAISKFILQITTIAKAITAGPSIIKDTYKSIKEFLTSLFGIIKSVPLLTKIIMGFAAVLYMLYVAGMRITKLTAETVKSFGEYSFGLINISKVTDSLINSNSGLIYSTETVIKAVSDVMNTFLPLGTTFESVIKHGATDIVRFSLIIDRFARSIGSSATELSNKLVEFASYFGYNLTKILTSGEKGIFEFLSNYTRFAGFILQKTRLTMSNITQIFSSVFERIMWMGSIFTDINKQSMLNLANVVGSIGKKFSLTVEHSRKLMEQFAGIIADTTWDMYAGILAATGRWTGSLDEMIYKSLTTTPFEKARETAGYFMNIAKTSAGLDKTWVAVVPQFKNIIARFPEEVDIFREAVETWIQSGNIDFKEALSRSGLSPEKIDEMMLVMDAFGNPLQTLITLVKRILDKLTLIVGRLASFGLTSIAKMAR